MHVNKIFRGGRFEWFLYDGSIDIHCVIYTMYVDTAVYNTYATQKGELSCTQAHNGSCVSPNGRKA